mmetsp:Transcript_65076/g.210764  ORF Transcript_65076/g.210764 Transcript_65076/m.210764 type:complete len:156 (+) Transcript_65076:206-673(+)
MLLGRTVNLEHDSHNSSGVASFSTGTSVSSSFPDLEALRRELRLQLDEPEDNIGDGLHHMAGGPASALRARHKTEDVEAARMLRTDGIPGSCSVPVCHVPTPPKQPRLNPRPALGATTRDTPSSTQPEMMPAPPSQKRQGAPAPRPKNGLAVISC